LQYADFMKSLRNFCHIHIRINAKQNNNFSQETNCTSIELIVTHKKKINPTQKKV